MPLYMAAGAGIKKLFEPRDIWREFPVIGDKQTDSESYGMLWNIGKLRPVAERRGLGLEALKSEYYPQIMDSLHTLPGYKVVDPPAGSKYFAMIVPIGRTRSPNKTRKWSKSPNKTRNSKSMSPEKTRKSKSPSKNVTRKSPAANVTYSGDELVAKARAIINKLSDATLDKLTKDLVTIVPKTDKDFKTMIELMFNMTLEQQAYHPLIIHVLHAMNEKHDTRAYPMLPSDALANMFLERVVDEPKYVKLEIASEEGEIEEPEEDHINKLRSYYRSCMLFIGFLYREDMISYEHLHNILDKLMKQEPDADDYRLKDAYIQGLIFIMIRAGKRIEMEDNKKDIEKIRKYLEDIPKRISRGPIKALSSELLEAMDNDYKIKEGTPWTVGAPKSDIKKRAAATAVVAAKPAAAEKLGADISELWRRFPLDVKQRDGLYLVNFHRKKLEERYEKESRKFKSIKDLENSLLEHIMRLVEKSDDWTIGPDVAGALFTVKSKTSKLPSPSHVAKPVVVAEKLGSDISELWKRFPLDVKPRDDMYVVNFHNKKLRDRYELESRKFKSMRNFEDSLLNHIERLIKNSDHWKFGPNVAGALFTIVAKK